MNLRRRYLTYMVLALVPQLHGCLWDSIHIDGTLDAEMIENDSKEQSEESVPMEKEDMI